MRTFDGVEAFVAAEGETLGPSEWVTVDQQRIERFADATDDHQWIHVDPVRAADGPFGTTIAHGFLTLSLLPQFLHRLYRVDGAAMAVNYGLERVRFPAPVPSGARLRAHARIDEITRIEGGVQGRLSTSMELEGTDKPACVVDSLVRYYA